MKIRYSNFKSKISGFRLYQFDKLRPKVYHIQNFNPDILGNLVIILPPHGMIKYDTSTIAASNIMEYISFRVVHVFMK